MTRLGRNDPCHCGSGKKYKKCHLDADQRHRAATRPLRPEPESNAPLDAESPSAVYDIYKLPALLQRLAEQGPAHERKKFGEMLSKTHPILEYMERKAEIEAACAALEAHRSEFEKLAANPDRFLALARSVFSEECFAPLRFRASDIQNAFGHVGYPAIMSPDNRTAQTLRAAILHIADKARRSELSMRLLLLLPQFVAAERYPEAWLVQSVAYDTAEHDEESNAFLFQMFSYAYDEWAVEKQSKDESLLRELGLDPDILRSMNLDELDSWVQSQSSDPEKARAMEHFFRRNPHLREESVANLEAMERNSARLLEREDSRFLLLSIEETQPWLELLNKRSTEQGLLSDTPSEESARKYFEELAVPLMQEMAISIFTAERIRQLVADLKKYRSDLFAAGDKASAGEVMGAIGYLEREDSPGENTFLLTLCWRSLTSAIETTVTEPGRSAE